MNKLLNVVDTIAVTGMLVCCCCFDAEGINFLIVLGVACLIMIYSLVRFSVCEKREERKRYWAERRAYYDIVERERRKQWN